MIKWPSDNSKFQNRARSLAYALALILPCTFILDNKATNVCFVSISILWLYLTFTSKEGIKFRFRNVSVKLFLIFFLLQVISLFYTENMQLGLKNIETKLPFLLMPLVAFSGYSVLEKIDPKKSLFFFAQSICAACVFILARIVMTSDKLGEAWHYYTFENLSGVISIHPGYFSLYACFSILILIAQFNSYSRRRKIIITLEILMLILFAFRLASRMPIVGLGLGLLAYAVFERKFKLLVAGIVAVGLLSFLLTESSPDIKERYLRPLRLTMRGDIDSLKAYAFNRLEIYSCATELLSGPTLLTGVGNGDANESLIKCYDKHDYWWISRQKYNAHNEFFQTILEVGIAGGLILVFLLIFPLRFWSTIKEFPLFSLLFGILSLTESTLQVQKGVVFFCFFYTLFISFAQKKKETCKSAYDLP